VYAVIYWWMR